MMDDLLNDFICETRETLDALAGEIVAWESDPSDRARLDAIFRFVHTVKGSCGFLDLPPLQKLSHAAEDALAEVRAGERVADAALVSAVLGVIDRIGELTQCLELGEPLPEGEEHFLIAALKPGAVPVPANAALVEPTPRSGMVAAPQPARAAVRTIRLPVELLDRMMAGVSDMVLARNELGRRLRTGAASAQTDMAFERLSLCVGEMREAITRTRMSRIDSLFSVLPRMVRDLAGELGKRVMLDIGGADVELDREMIEMIRDPLTHIVRNALDHGIEPPADRLKAGKAETGRLAISARQSGNQILIDITDDGRGIDGERLLQKAMAAGIITTDQAATMSWSRKLDLIFEPGLTTAAAVTGISGRGVGMDVVRANIERIGGTVEIDSRPGQGLRLSLRVPLTLTIIPALTVSSGAAHFAIPRSAIDEIVRPKGETVRIERLGGGLVAFIRGLRLPVIDLASFMGLNDGPAVPPLLVVLHAGSGERFALGVEAVHDHEELVVKPAAPALMASGLYAGTTLPDNSQPMLLLDVAGIAAAAGVGVCEASPEEAPDAAAGSALLPTLLFRDLDGITRGVRLSLVERIEDVAREGAMETGGTRLLAHQGQLLPLQAFGPLPTGDKLRVLRLTDGAVQLAYVIEHVIDVVDLDADLSPVRIPGPIAGVVLSEGRPIELLDAYWLFANAADAAAKRAEPPLCLIADAGDPWAREVLAPLLGTAGYRVSFGSDAAPGAVSVIVTVGAEAPAGYEAPVVRLRTTPGESADGTVYRYDRDGLLRALGARLAARG